MLDERVRTLARKRIEVAIEERWRPLDREVSDTGFEFAKAGRSGSGNMYLSVLQLYEVELDIRASIAWGEIYKVLATFGIGRLERLATDLKAFIDEMIEWIASGLSDRLGKNSMSNRARLEATGSGAPLDEAKTHALRKYHAEIDLFVAGLEQTSRADPKQGATHVNVYGGQIGILQTGASSTASMTVHLDASSRQEIARALTAAERLVEAATHTPFDRAEISEMIRESKSELDKPGPNVSRLRSLMVGVATSIQTVASLRPAYDVIKGALALVGVTLP